MYTANSDAARRVSFFSGRKRIVYKSEAEVLREGKVEDRKYKYVQLLPRVGDGDAIEVVRASASGRTGIEEIYIMYNV